MFPLMRVTVNIPAVHNPQETLSLERLIGQSQMAELRPKNKMLCSRTQPFQTKKIKIGI